MPHSKKKFTFPHPIVLLFSIVLIVAICSYFVPAGEYTRVKAPGGRMVVDPASYTEVEKRPISPFNFFLAFPKGLTQAGEITFFIMVVSAAFSIITATGAVEAIMARVAVSFRSKERLMIPAMVFLFSCGGASFGMSEENVVFVPIGIALARALGLDAMVGTSMVVMGTACGFCAGVINPFTIGVAQGIAELPMFSGLGLRLVVWVVLVVVTSAFIMRYASKVRANPSSSLIYDLEIADRGSTTDLSNIPTMTGRQKLVMGIILVGFVYLVYGVLKQGWYVSEIAALFLAMGILCGLVYGFGPTKISTIFQNGVKEIANGAIMVGIARAILVVMQESLIIDTAVHALSGLISSLPGIIGVLGMYFVQIMINFFIPSGSGQAAATMPIMVPLSDVLGINRQVAVLCFQFGDGFTNNILPVSGTLMAILGMAKIPYEKWLKFVGPLVLIWIAIGGVFVLIADTIHYGPF
ncbi:MAG: AbgT family transporter [Anaerovoracaceae bacterium]